MSFGQVDRHLIIALVNWLATRLRVIEPARANLVLLFSIKVNFLLWDHSKSTWAFTRIIIEIFVGRTCSKIICTVFCIKIGRKLGWISFSSCKFDMLVAYNLSFRIASRLIRGIPKISLGTRTKFFIYTTEILCWNPVLLTRIRILFF